MSWRTVIISRQSKIDYKMGYLVIRGPELSRILLDEIAILVIENPRVSFTGVLIEQLVHKKIKVVFCDSKYNPVAELIPHHGSHDSSLKIRIQMDWNESVKNEIWREIIIEKIKKQAGFLFELGKKEEGNLLTAYISQVEPGDASNREGHAAKVYFNALFGMDFTRGADNAINAALNYGYSIVLSAFTREISINGYLTQLGVAHANRFNPFNLASDFMEPFRIVVDRIVRNNITDQFEKEDKYELWKLLEQIVHIDGKHQTVSNAIKIYTKSLLDALNDNDSGLIKVFQFV